MRFLIGLLLLVSAQSAFADKYMTCNLLPWFNHGGRTTFTLKYEDNSFFSDRVYFRQDGKWVDFCEGHQDVKDFGATCVIGISGSLLPDVDRTKLACYSKNMRGLIVNADTNDCVWGSDKSMMFDISEGYGYFKREFEKRRLTLDFLLMEAVREEGKIERIKQPEDYNSLAKGFRRAFGEGVGSDKFEELRDSRFTDKVSCKPFEP